MRIIGGRWRRLRLDVPGDVAVRPTPDRVRETLFNWLAPMLADNRCLDLFAGTGVLGLEALSRGAAHATFVERDRRLAGALAAVCNRLDCDATVINDDAERYLRGSDGESFELVFLDPPYDRELDTLLEAVSRVLKPGGLVYIERPAKTGLPTSRELRWRRKSSAGAVSFGLAGLSYNVDKPRSGSEVD